MKSKIYYNCIKHLFDLIAKISDGEGIDVYYANDYIRRCFPKLAVITLDYEEQVRVTGVKSNVYCTMCTIDLDKREDLEA